MNAILNLHKLHQAICALDRQPNIFFTLTPITLPVHSVQQEESQLWVGLEPLQLSQLSPSLKSPADIDSSFAADSVAFSLPHCLLKRLCFDHGCFIIGQAIHYQSR